MGVGKQMKNKMKKTFFILSILSCLLLNAQNDFTPREAEMLSKPIAFLGYDFGMMYFKCVKKVGEDSIILAKHSKDWLGADDVITKNELKFDFRHKQIISYPTFFDNSFENHLKQRWIFFDDTITSDAAIIAHIKQQYNNYPKEEFAIALLFHSIDCKEHTAEISIVYIDVANNKVLRIIRNSMRKPNQATKVKASSETTYFGYSGFYAFFFHDAYKNAIVWHDYYFKDLKKYKNKLKKQKKMIETD